MLKQKTLISSIPMCYVISHNVNKISLQQLLMLTNNNINLAINRRGVLRLLKTSSLGPLEIMYMTQPSSRDKWTPSRFATVDTRGVRDVFVAGFLRKVIQHQKLISEEPKLRDVLRISNACGAITTIERGVISALLDTETAEKLINQATLY